MDLRELRARWDAGERLSLMMFWGHQPAKDGTVGASCLSQWYVAPFTVDGVCYPTAEHWMMAEKARLFGDPEMGAQIVAASDPATAKALGRRVRGFDQRAWDAHKRAFVTAGNRHKFGQDPALAAFLRGTGEAVLVEASPRDRMWGIGLGRDNPKAADPRLWRGQNLLGFALMDVRAGLG